MKKKRTFKNKHKEEEESVENEKKDNAKTFDHNDHWERSNSTCKDCPKHFHKK